ncbi:MAG: hypothetical protein HY694_12035 [Deltaproteobacteria bacterium]|nr:hypothetical protein [Deltaproteobacteria bacterium]
MVKTKETLSFLILTLFVLLLSGRGLYAEPMKVTENLRREAVLLPSSAPDKSQLILVSSVRITSEGQVMALLAVYDDPRTKRSMDYLELYDFSGGLLLVSWVDRFGIRRTAMDSGLLQEEASKLEGVLVLLLEGTPS